VTLYELQAPCFKTVLR